MRDDDQYSRPFGPEGPLVRLIPQNELPKEGSELTYHGLKILRNIPVHRGGGIGVRTLAEELNALGDYGGFVERVDALAKRGYLKKDKETSRLTLTRKGRKELPPPEED